MYVQFTLTCLNSCLPYEVLLLTEVFEDIVLRAFLETFITSTNVSRLSVDVYRAKSVKQFSPRITLLQFWGNVGIVHLSSIKLPLLSNLQR